MRCEFEPAPDQPNRVRCNACGREMIRKPLPMAEHIAVDCGGAGPRKPNPPSEERAEIPCVHRGAELRRVPCNVGCGRGTMLPVYQCAARGECTASRFERGQTLPLCTTCDQRTP